MLSSIKRAKDTALNSKLHSFYLNAFILIVSTLVLALILDNLLLGYLPSLWLRITLITLIMSLFFLLLSHFLIEHFQHSQERLKQLLDETLHELNTPIATIKANLTLLKKNTTHPKTPQRLQRLTLASDRLSALYESVERSIREEIDETPKEHFDLAEIVKESMALFQEKIEKKGVTLRLDLPPQTIYADKEGFRKTLANLIDNAIKYNTQGGTLAITFCAPTLLIRDSGQGIETKNLFIIFEKAYQENPATKGFGLGLSIVKNYCDKEKITIKIDTHKGEGTTIMLDLSQVMK